MQLVTALVFSMFSHDGDAPVGQQVTRRTQCQLRSQEISAPLSSRYPGFIRQSNDGLGWKSAGIGASYWRRKSISLRRVLSGPNEAVWYTTDPLVLNRDSIGKDTLVAIYYAKSMAPSDPFSQLQTGGSGPAGRYCDASDLNTLREKVITHEQGHGIEEVGWWADSRNNLEESYLITDPKLSRAQVTPLLEQWLETLNKVYILTPSAGASATVDGPTSTYLVPSPNCIARWP